MTTIDTLTHLSDAELIARVHALANDERRATVALIASLAELDARRLFLAAGCSSLFMYCTRVLRLSEHAAYGRIEAARAARHFPVLLDLLADGALTLTAICLLAPHLTAENHQDVLAAVRHKTKRDVELLVATLRPTPAMPATVRKLPAVQPPATPGVAATGPDLLFAPLDTTAVSEPPSRPTPAQPRARSLVAPLAPERYKLQVTLSVESYHTLLRAQDLLRRIPANVRRDVWKRDGGQCAFVGTQGRCSERGFLEFHHVVPYSDGGESVVKNLELRCRAHNAYEAARWDGTLFARESAVSFFELGPDRALGVRAFH